MFKGGPFQTPGKPFNTQLGQKATYFPNGINHRDHWAFNFTIPIPQQSLHRLGFPKGDTRLGCQRVGLREFQKCTAGDRWCSKQQRVCHPKRVNVPNKEYTSFGADFNSTEAVQLSTQESRSRKVSAFLENSF